MMSRLRDAKARVRETLPQHQPSPTVPLPSWQELARSAVSLDPELSQLVDAIKQRGPNWRYALARGIVHTLLRDDCYEKMLRYSWSEVIDFTADHIARNKLLELDAGHHQLPDCHERTDSQFFRAYDQMPCTQATALRRVAKAQEMISREQPVLLLGDDDMVSIELAAAGFGRVTAVDIDPKILTDLKKAAARRGVSVRLVQHDLSQPVPATLKDDYALVMFDPAYSLASVEMFLRAGLDATSRRAGTRFFISVHLMSLFDQGSTAVNRLFSDEGLDILEFHQGFNVYPNPGRLKSLIHLVNRFVIGLKSAAMDGWSLPYLLSDAIILRKK